MPDGTLTATSLWTAASDALPGGGSASGAEVAAYDAARKLVLVLGP